MEMRGWNLPAGGGKCWAGGLKDKHTTRHGQQETVSVDSLLPERAEQSSRIQNKAPNTPRSNSSIVNANLSTTHRSTTSQQIPATTMSDALYSQLFSTARQFHDWPAGPNALTKFFRPDPPRTPHPSSPTPQPLSQRVQNPQDDRTCEESEQR